MIKYSINLVFVLLLCWGVSAYAVEQTLIHIEKPTIAPPLILSDIDGVEHDLAQYAGKVVIVNFWATWCPPCREEMPSMQRLLELRQASGLVLLAVNVGEDEDTIFQFTADYPIGFPLLLDLNSSVPQAWSVQGLPTTYVIDKQGRVVYRAIGGREWDSKNVVNQIDRLL